MFGWETQTIEGGGMEFTFWRLRGYGDFLESLDPEMRRRQRESGAPEGFDDAVAWFQPMTAGQFPDEVPPHWSTTFAVDDADASAEKATELGGTVPVGAARRRPDENRGRERSGGGDVHGQQVLPGGAVAAPAIPPSGIVEGGNGGRRRRHPGYIDDKEAVLRRLSRIEGQVRGVRRMVGEEAYCIDVLTQIAAVERARSTGSR